MRKFNKIVLHCSDSEFGHVLMIREWHVQRGWKNVGYHCVILNSYPTNDWFKNKIAVPYLEGSVEWGRAVDSDEWFEGHEIGAHVKGFNTGSFGICMIGKNDFSDKVLNSALNVVRFHMKQFDLSPVSIYGHCELNREKSCPNINMTEFRAKLVAGTNYGRSVLKKEKVTFFQLLLKLFTKGKKHG